MEDFKNSDSLKDPFLEGMLYKLPQYRTKDSFTSEVMNQIYASVEPEIEPSVYRRQMLWAYGLIGAGIIIILFIILAIWPFIDVRINFSSVQILDILNGALSFMNEISKIADYIKESSLQITIFLSVFVLFIIERLFRRGTSNSTYVL